MLSSANSKKPLISKSQIKQPNKPIISIKQFIDLKKIVYSKLVTKYSPIYINKPRLSNQIDYLTKSPLTYYELFKINELTLDQKTHYNIIYKELLLQLLSNELFRKVYHRLESEIIIKSLLTIQTQFPANLFACGFFIYNIINRRNNCLKFLLKQRNKWYTTLQLQSESIKKQQQHGLNKSNSNDIEKDEFHLSKISLSMSIKEIKQSARRNERSSSHAFASASASSSAFSLPSSTTNRKHMLMINNKNNQEHYHRPLIKSSLYNDEEKDIEEVKIFINQIQRIEEDALRIIPVRKHKDMRLFSNENKRNVNKCNANINALTNNNTNSNTNNMLMLSNIQSIDMLNNNRIESPKKKVSLDLRTIVLDRANKHKRKFKSIEEFIKTNEEMIKERKNMNTLFNNLNNVYYLLQLRKRDRTIRLNAFTNSNSNGFSQSKDNRANYCNTRITSTKKPIKRRCNSLENILKKGNKNKKGLTKALTSSSNILSIKGSKGMHCSKSNGNYTKAKYPMISKTNNHYVNNKHMHSTYSAFNNKHCK